MDTTAAGRSLDLEDGPSESQFCRHCRGLVRGNGQLCPGCTTYEFFNLSQRQQSIMQYSKTGEMQSQSSVDISQSTLNSVSGGQFNASGSQLVFNLSNMSSDSVVSVRSTDAVTTISSANSSRSAINHRSHRMSGDSSGADYMSDSQTNARERARRQRLETEAKRRKGMRDAFSELKGELISSSSDSVSDLAILRAATNQIRQLRAVLQRAKISLAKSHDEVARLRKANDELMIIGTLDISGTNPPGGV